MKLIVFLSLVAFAYSYSVSYGIGKNINVQKDGTVAIWSPLGKRIVLANVLGSAEPRYIDVVVEDPSSPNQKFQIDTVTGLPVRIHPYNLGETIKVIDVVEGKKILGEMLEGLPTQEIMTSGEELYQTGLLQPAIYNLLKLWQQQQDVQSEINPTSFQQIQNIIRKQQQQQILPQVYQQEVENIIPYVKYGQQMPVLPQQQYQNILFQLQQQVPLHQILAQLQQQQQQQQQILPQVLQQEVENIIPYVKYGQQVPVLPQQQYHNILLQLQQQVPLQQILAQLQQTPLQQIQHLAMMQQVLSQRGQSILLPWEAQLLLQLQQQKAMLQQDIQVHYQQGHPQIVLIELQQWKQLQEQEENLLEQIHMRAFSKGNALNLLTVPSSLRSYQYQPLGLQQEYIRNQQQVVPQQEFVQLLLGGYGQKQGYGYEQQYGYGQGYGQGVGGIKQQMVLPQQLVY